MQEKQATISQFSIKLTEISKTMVQNVKQKTRQLKKCIFYTEHYISDIQCVAINHWAINVCYCTAYSAVLSNVLPTPKTGVQNMQSKKNINTISLIKLEIKDELKTIVNCFSNKLQH